MAYLVFSIDGYCAKICANDEEKNNLVLPTTEEYVIKSVSESDFINVKSNQKWATLSGDTINYTDVDVTFSSSDRLKTHFDNLKTYLSRVENHPSHPIHDGVVAYMNYLDGVDTASIIPNAETPLESSWEKYCLDNSITFYHPLQIP
jgi:hypothetical protein